MSSDIASGCEGKSGFRSWAAADAVCKRQRKRQGVHVEPYRCRHCGHYHVGNSTVTEKQKRRDVQRKKQERDE